MRAAALILVLAACAPRATLEPVETPFAGETRAVYTATLRAFQDETGQFEGERTTDLSLHRYDITLPTDREIGEVTFASRNVDPDKHMLVKDTLEFSSDRDFFKAISRSKDQGTALLFVHGYNNTHADGVLRTAQMVTDYEIPGPALHFSWASSALPFGYAYDAESATLARDAMEDVLRGILGRKDVMIAAHSMGSWLVMEALRQIAIAGDHHLLNNITALVLISPDLDVDIFKAQAARIEHLPDPFVIFTSNRDHALRLSSLITGRTSRLGNLDDDDLVSDLDVTLIDLTEFEGGDALGHFTAATSPEAIRFIRGLSEQDARGPTPRAGLGAGTVIQLRRASRLVLRPAPG